MAVTHVLGPDETIKRTGDKDATRHTLRAAADAGVIDSFKTDTGHRCFPLHAPNQLKAHLVALRKAQAAALRKEAGRSSQEPLLQRAE